MSLPITKKKMLSKSVTSPEKYLSHNKRIKKDSSYYNVEGIILSYSNSLIDYALKQYNAKNLSSPYGNYSIIKKNNKSIGVLGKFGIGAPLVATLLEELIALGCKNFITLGTAGAIGKDLKVGDIIICNRAIRDEGTSYHYVKPSKYAYCKEDVINKMSHILTRNNIVHRVGCSWTTDAPYRETEIEVLKYQNEGVLTVEMEASALYSLAKYHNVSIGAFFVISDKLSNLVWEPNFSHKIIKVNLAKLFDLSLELMVKLDKI